jgi:hypothetical protein
MYSSITLGRSSNAIVLFVPKAPPVNDAPERKAQVFDFLADLLNEHRLLFSSAELISAFQHIPCNSYAAVQESGLIAALIQSSFFTVDNLVGLGFRNSVGATLSSTGITNDASSRPPDLFSFAFRATIDAAQIDHRIVMPPITLEFLLPLPQTTQPNPSLSGANITGPTSAISRQLATQFATPTTGTAAFSTGTHGNVVAHGTPITAANIDAMDVQTRGSIANASGTDQLSDYSADAFTKLTALQLQTLVLRTPVTQAPGSGTPITSISPRMQTVFDRSSNGGFTYYGPLDFLDHQLAFDNVFPDPVPFVVSHSTATPTSGNHTSSILATIRTFVDQAKFLVFVPIFRTDYVGTADRNDAAALSHTIKALKKLAMSSRNPTNGSWANISPDELFAEYSALTPMLPANVSLWGLNLASQYHDGLSNEIQDLLADDPSYTAPILSSLITKTSQLAALRNLRLAAVRLHSSIKKQESLIARTVNRRLKAAQTHATQAVTLRNTPPGIASTFVSPAESTMQRYQPQIDPSFPIDPLTGFKSPHPIGHRGCMVCGSNDHVFTGCSRREETGSKDTFFRNLFAHKPHLRKLPPRPSEIQPGFVPQTLPSLNIIANSHLPELNQPAISPPLFADPFAQDIHPPIDELAAPTPSRASINNLPPAVLDPPLNNNTISSPTKKVRYFVNTVRTFSQQINLPPALPPMPIAIDNGLPHITLCLGNNPSDNKLQGLMDTCGALNTGYLPFHQWVMATDPSFVAEYVEFDDTNPFEPIKLGGAIREPDGFDAGNHGRLTAVIRYHTPYCTYDGNPVTISLALGNDVTVNTIFGLPMLSAFDSIISLSSNALHSNCLNMDFAITRQAPVHGLPPGASINNDTNSRAILCRPKVKTNIAWEDIKKPLICAKDDTTMGYLQRRLEPSL